MLRSGTENNGLRLGLKDGDCIRKRLGGTHETLGILWKHDDDLDTEDTLAEVDVSDGLVEVLGLTMTGVNSESISELNP